jgi:hypothetical protein
MQIQGNKLLWTSVATLLGSAGVLISNIAQGQQMSNEAIMTGLAAIAAIFGALKGKRIEAKLDALHEKVGK